jgi:hypothetical protein
VLAESPLRIEGRWEEGKMTRIMRLRIPVLNVKEWVSVLPGSDRDHVIVVRQNGDEVELSVDIEQPIEPQISRGLESRPPARLG